MAIRGWQYRVTYHLTGVETSVVLIVGKVGRTDVPRSIRTVVPDFLGRWRKGTAPVGIEVRLGIAALGRAASRSVITC